MPGVNLDSPIATSALELDSPVEVIDHLSKNEELAKEKLNSILCQAVQEIHLDLKAFGKQVDKRYEEAMTKVTPLVQTLTQLQEENKILKIELERLVRQVEVLCRATGLQESLLETLRSPEVQSTHLGVPQGSVLVPQNFQPSAKEANSCSEDLPQENFATNKIFLHPEDLEFPVSPSDLGNSEFCLDFTLLNTEIASDLPTDVPQQSVEENPLNSPTALPQEYVLDPLDFAPTESNGVLNSLLGVPQVSLLGSQEFESSSANSTLNAVENEPCGSKPEEPMLPESSTVPHTLAFFPHRSLSAPTLVGNAPGSTVTHELLAPHCNPLTM